MLLYVNYSMLHILCMQPTLCNLFYIVYASIWVDTLLLYIYTYFTYLIIIDILAYYKFAINFLYFLHFFSNLVCSVPVHFLPHFISFHFISKSSVTLNTHVVSLNSSFNHTYLPSPFSITVCSIPFYSKCCATLDFIISLIFHIVPAPTPTQLKIRLDISSIPFLANLLEL